MAFKDLREFIDELEQRGLLKRITAEVDCELEITEITDRVSKMEGEKNVALLFENVKGYDMPVLMNAFGSMERMAIALGVEQAWAAQFKDIDVTYEVGGWYDSHTPMNALLLSSEMRSSFTSAVSSNMTPPTSSGGFSSGGGGFSGGGSGGGGGGSW